MQKRGYKVPPLGGQDIFAISKELRKQLDMSDVIYMDIAWLLETLGCYDILDYEYCEDSDTMHYGEAFYNPVEKKILIPDSVYNAACVGKGRARFTIAHEMGHFFLKHSAVLGRNNDTTWKAYIDSEWQADAFAGYFLAPPSLVDPRSTAENIAVDFGLSFQAARIALNNAKKFRS